MERRIGRWWSLRRRGWRYSRRRIRPRLWGRRLRTKCRRVKESGVTLSSWRVFPWRSSLDRCGWWGLGSSRRFDRLRRGGFGRFLNFLGDPEVRRVILFLGRRAGFSRFNSFLGRRAGFSRFNSFLGRRAGFSRFNHRRRTLPQTINGFSEPVLEGYLAGENTGHHRDPPLELTHFHEVWGRLWQDSLNQ
jgi:hypothetical protein